MDLESLRIFRNVVEAGGFSKASPHCGLTQSAISKQIANLENQIGHQVIDRSKQTIELTKAGKLLYERSEVILNEVDQTEQLLRGYAGGPPPRLQMGTTLSIGISYFPGIFTNFTKKHPDIRLDIRVDVSSELTRAVEQREIDCAVVCLPQRLPKQIAVAERFLDPLTLVVSNEYIRRKKYHLPVAKKVMQQILQEEPMILIAPKTYTRKIIDHFLFEQGIMKDPVIELESFDLIVTFVSLGLGVSIVPQRVFPVYSRSRSVSCQKVGNLKLNRELGIIYHQSRKDQPELQAFIDNFAF